MQERDTPGMLYSDTLHDWVCSLNATTYSATFAGIDSPGTALLEWHYAVSELVRRESQNNRCLPTRYVGPTTRWLLEWDTACQHELERHPGTGYACRFLDMSSLWKPSIQTLVTQVRNAKGGKIVDSLAKAVKSGHAVKSKAYCLTHKQECYLCPCTLHIGGSPCTDNSNMGDKAGEEGKTMVDTLAWLAHIVACEHTAFVSENVPSEELVATIKRLLGHMYTLHVVRDEANPCKLGWPVNRPRQFIVGFHKLKASASMPLPAFISSFARNCKLTWRDFLIADEAELLREKQWALARPCCRLGMPTFEDLHRIQSTEGVGMPTFEDLLSPAAHDVLKAYRAKCPSNCAWSLNQYPENGRARHSTPTTLHTIIRNVGFLWDDTSLRWFTWVDLLAAQGFNLTGGSDVCSFQVPRRDRKRSDVMAQVGNAMHVNSIGAVIAFVLEMRKKTGSAFDCMLSDNVLAARRKHRNMHKPR
jgi:site-specific DNA-cytosine methylase